MPHSFVYRLGWDRGVAAPRSTYDNQISRLIPDFNQMLAENQRRWRSEARTHEAVEKDVLAGNK